MNQAILFSDDQVWNEEQQQVEFSAQCMGALILCVVPSAVLEKLSGKKVIDAESALEQFIQYRFDIEELAESLIEDEEFNAAGQVMLS